MTNLRLYILHWLSTTAAPVSVGTFTDSLGMAYGVANIRSTVQAMIDDGTVIEKRNYRGDMGIRPAGE